MFYLIIFSTLLISSNASKLDHRSSNRVVGGYPVNVTDIPFIGSLQVATSDSFQHYCGFVIISELFATTAGHCVQSRRAEEFRMRLNSSYHAEGGFTLTPADIIIHPEFDNSTYDYDIALLVLPESLDLINYPGIRAIDLPHQDEKFEDGLITFVCGWGQTQDPNESRDQLRCGGVPLVNQVICENSFRSRNVTARMICAGDLVVGGIDACQGDSGGPLYYERENGEKVLVGLVSWGILCATHFYPGIYTRMPYFRDWIDSYVNNYRHK